MELKKYNHIAGSFREWDEGKQPYFFTVEWESIEEPGILKSWTGANRVTGVDRFIDSIEKLQKYPNCGKIHITAYSGKTGKKTLLVETLPIYEPSYPYAIQQLPVESKKTAEPQQPIQQPSIFNAENLLGALLGIGSQGGGLNGTELMGGLLTIRDKGLRTEFEIKDYQKEIADLKLKNIDLERQLVQANQQIDELDTENEGLLGSIDELNTNNQALQKYVPENSKIGISLTAVGTSILEGFVKRMVNRNPQAVANLLGTDLGTLNGLFESAPQAASHQTVESKAVSVELAGEEENATPQRKSELEAISSMVVWLKSLNNIQLTMVLKLMQMWAKDNETLEMHFNWAFGGRNSQQ